MNIYGISEIAEATGVPPGTLSVRKTRGQLPAPDWVLRMGPVWKASTIRPFLERERRKTRKEVAA